MTWSDSGHLDNVFASSLEQQLEDVLLYRTRETFTRRNQIAIVGLPYAAERYRDEVTFSVFLIPFWCIVAQTVHEAHLRRLMLDRSGVTWNTWKAERIAKHNQEHSRGRSLPTLAGI
jgi:hypothetical protein